MNIFKRKEKSDDLLKSVTNKMGIRLLEEIQKGNNNKEITVTFDPTEYGYLVAYLIHRTGTPHIL